MKRLQSIVLVAMITMAIFSATVYSSCTKDACSGVTCQHSGTCLSGKCNCSPYYEGDHCENGVNVKFAGTYNGKDCSGSNNSITILSATDPTTITFEFLDGAAPVICKGTKSGSISISSQIITDGMDSYTLSGSGTLTGNKLSLDLNIKDNSTGDFESCNFTGVK